MIGRDVSRTDDVTSTSEQTAENVLVKEVRTRLVYQVEDFLLSPATEM